MKFSHSAFNTFKECPRKYRLHYLDKIRPVTKSSAFIFGSAIDNALEEILKGNDNYIKTFDRTMITTDINNLPVVVRSSHLIKYYSKDLQLELLEDDDIDEIKQLAEELEFKSFDMNTFVNFCIDERKAKKHLEEDDQRLFNCINWYSLKRKGYMILEKVKTWVDENIEEVYEVQKYLTIENADGDVIRGYLDFKAKFKDGVTRIVDLKTSSGPKRDYPDDSASKSQQLAIYAEIEGTYDVAYYIVDKVIRKREPRVRDRYVTGYIEPDFGDEVFEDLEITIGDIKSSIEKNTFDKNKNSCYNYGGCPYYNYCHKNENMLGLVDLKEKTDGSR